MDSICKKEQEMRLKAFIATSRQQGAEPVNKTWKRGLTSCDNLWIQLDPGCGANSHSQWLK